MLALGMLTADPAHARTARARCRGRPRRMQDIPAEDRATYDMICRADTIGVFQIESRAQMSMLPRLRPRSFYDLVIEVAIVRPGPIQGGMVHPYLQRRHDPASVTYPSPALEQVLQRTLGVPIFQEQVMQIAVVAAGFTPGEADQLRRSMAAWKRKGGLEPFRDGCSSGMRAQRLPAGIRRAASSGRSGASANTAFPNRTPPRSRCSTYVSCWLKCHEPAAFFAALLNSQPMGFYQPAQLLQEARRARRRACCRRTCCAATGTARWSADARGAAGASASGCGRCARSPQADARRVVAARAREPFARHR